ncbi:MAG TPA: hypothetical protein VJ846_05135 [Sphingomicrobium sp.]|nr:hypothetical protein [Sphingomicrobium sp.]
MIVIHRSVYSSQMRGCWLSLQIGYTAIGFKHLPKPNYKKGPAIRLFIAAPAHDPQIGYRRTHFGVWLRRARFSLKAGEGYGLPAWMR